MKSVYVLTTGWMNNDHDCNMFVDVFAEKPTLSDLWVYFEENALVLPGEQDQRGRERAIRHILRGGGPRKGDFEWYFLKEVKLQLSTGL